ncbi:DUF1543 domain-containing protein [bacterium]|nr:DUF1543 domain-containing protein [bacterium]
MPRLFAVLLGGNCAPRSNIELHDIVFVAGESLAETYPRLLELWFGTPAGLHVDSWLELAVVDGHRIVLGRDPAAAGAKLFFVNLGGYRAGEFAELHARTFVVAASADEAKERAKATLMGDCESVHTDDLYDVDEVLEVGVVGEWHVGLEPGAVPVPLEPHNGWLPLPEELIAAFAARRPDAR